MFRQVQFLQILTAALAFLLTLSASSSVAAGCDWDLKLANSSIQWPRSDLKNVYQRYWSSRYAGETKINYQLEIPYYQEIKSYQNYHSVVINSSKMTLKKVEIQSIVALNPDCFEVKARFHCEKPDHTKITFFMLDRWVRVDKAWSHVIMNPLINPLAR